MRVPSYNEIIDSGPALVRAQWYLRSATSLGSKVRVWGKPLLRNRGRLIIGNRVRIASDVATTELGVGPDGCLEIGDGVFINYGCSIAATLSVKIGANCSIGSHVTMMDNDFHHLDPERRNEIPPSSPIVLEENVWLGVRVVVLRGVTVGTGSVIAAGSVVVRDVPPRSLAGGMPAKVIRAI